MKDLLIAAAAGLIVYGIYLKSKERSSCGGNAAPGSGSSSTGPIVVGTSSMPLVPLTVNPPTLVPMDSGNMVQSYDASRIATVSPPTTTVVLPAGAGMTDDLDPLSGANMVRE